MNEYEGRCHCGAIGWRYRTALVPSDWPVRSCQCTFCRSHQTRCTSDPNGSVEFDIVEPALLKRYSFGLRTAEFLVCSECGNYIGALATADETPVATLNLNVLRTPVSGLSEPDSAHYEAEDSRSRIERRKVRWTPVTRLA